jgi:hypothetical protein
MWIDGPRSTVNRPQYLLLTVDYGLSTERHGISGTTGFTPFVVVVGSNIFCRCRSAFLLGQRVVKSSFDFLLR